MYQFNHHKPTTVEEAVAAFNSAEDPAYLSGGMTLIPTMKQRLAAPTDLVDLSGVAGLSGISVQGDSVHIGAFTRHAQVARSPEISA